MPGEPYGGMGAHEAVPLIREGGAQVRRQQRRGGLLGTRVEGGKVMRAPGRGLAESRGCEWVLEIRCENDPTENELMSPKLSHKMLI